VTTNNVSLSLYELDRLLIDVLAARRLGADPDALDPWVAGRRAAWYGGLAPAGPLEQLLRRGLRAVWSSAGHLPGAVRAVWDSPHDRTLDVVGIDYYDPVVAHQVRVPGHRTAGGRAWHLGAALWDDRLDPDGLARYGEANVMPGLGLWVVENGMCNRVRRGRSYPRLDGWDRPRFLRRHVAAVVDLLERGAPLGAYYHWTLTDNYEWGSYEPRFGIHGVDRERGVRILDTDSMGRDAAGTYRAVIDGLRAGNRCVLLGD
jgi:beta-glucosidase